MMPFDDVLTFWFDDLEPQQWWRKNGVVDAEISRRFNGTHRAACTGELADWRKEPAGRLAEIIVLDQFSRNLFRDDARAFAQDDMALLLAQEAIATGADKIFGTPKKAFFYMPFMHSESLLIHGQAVRLFNQPGAEFNLEFEMKHKAIIDRFGRYPHLNVVLGRESTPEERVFLASTDALF